ncbi:MAG: hypothetical protein LBK54_06080 [Propionibacteriaceae bacterium]|jgi:hypothetical protein|nr:hypothetical protein [Propionibacteriaceae bacterium]
MDEYYQRQIQNERERIASFKHDISLVIDLQHLDWARQDVRDFNAEIRACQAKIEEWERLAKESE